MAILSTPALASTNGRYLFQSMERTSVVDAGMVSVAAVRGVAKLPAPPILGAYVCVRRSKILIVPSVEQVARISG